jgi:hypothetical protein
VGQTGLIGEEHQFDRCATTSSKDFKAEDTRRNLNACVDAKQGAVIGHPFDGGTMKIPKVHFGVVCLSFMN